MALQERISELGQGCEQLTLFPVDFLASRFPWPESKPGKQTNATYFLKCCGLSPTLSRVSSSVRMYLESCELPLPTLSRVWSVRDIGVSCLILKLHLSERRTDDRGCFFVAHRDGAWELSGAVPGNQKGHGISDGGEAVANSDCFGCGEPYVSQKQSRRTEAGRTSPDVSYAKVRREQIEQSIGHETWRPCGGGRWPVEPDVGRVANGVSDRVDRIRALGNAVVPAQAYPIFKAIAEELTRREDDELDI